jgi:TPR repeat protein
LAAAAVLWAAALVLALSPAQAETRVALVIGNSGYTTKPLDNPVHDADLMARTLRGVEFQVTLLIDADQAAMKRAILDFGRQLRGTDSVGLFYYAGHGVQVDGENFLIPVGADITDLQEVALNGVNLSELLKTMERAASRLNIAILDACRDNPFVSSTRSSASGLALVTAPTGTLIAYATAPGQVALDGDGPNSPYTAALAAAIPTPGVPLEEVFRRTRRKVLEVTANKQTPWEHSSLTGEFYFKPKSAEAEATLPPGELADAAAARRLAEIKDWEAIKDSGDPTLLRRHMARFPGGLFGELAAWRAAQIEAKATPWAPVVTGGTSEPAGPNAAEMYERGLKIESERKGSLAQAEAAELFRRAADLGLPAAMFSLGRAYDKGLGVDRNSEVAAQWYREAADAGHGGAMASLGTMYEFGEGVPVNIAEAVKLYREAADKDDANGMTSLGFLYAEGKGVARDLAEARRWYAKAAERGQTRAMFNLALLLMRGRGGPVNLVEAVRLLQVASDKGHAGAMRELAYLYDEGRGVARNPKRAAELILSSYAAGDKQARSDVLDRHDTWSFTTRREIQRRLAVKGYYSGPVHGFFDSRTRKALDKLASRG